jgi:hypothetical protein
MGMQFSLVPSKKVKLWGFFERSVQEKGLLLQALISKLFIFDHKLAKV